LAYGTASYVSPLFSVAKMLISGQNLEPLGLIDTSTYRTLSEAACSLRVAGTVLVGGRTGWCVEFLCEPRLEAA